MPRRIEIELTSSRDDGTWTWRAAGAKEPRGTLPTTILPNGSKVGDVLRVDAEFFVDGIEITGVVPTKDGRREPERLELLAAASEEPLVTTTLATRSRDDRRPRREGGREGGRRDRDGRGGPRREGEGDRDRKDRRERKDGPPRRSRPEPPPVPVVERPKAKRLRAGKAHRNALLESLPEAERPVAEQVALGGLPAVRQAIEKQNAERAAGGESAIAAGPLLELAEKLVPKVRAAEWRDRVEAAQRDIEVLDLRDLRSVVSTADAAAKDEESRALAAELRNGLSSRVDAEHAAWLAELTATVDVGRIVRALRLSSRPPKAGAPLPPELATRLADGAGAALTADAAPERWVAVLDVLAFSPVRDKVIPASLPTDLHADVKATIARTATRIPKIAHIFEITPDRSAPRPKQERRRPKKPAASKPSGTKEQGRRRPPKSEEKGPDEGPAPEPTELDAAAAPVADRPAADTGPDPDAAQAPIADAPDTDPAVGSPDPEAASPDPAEDARDQLDA